MNKITKIAAGDLIGFTIKSKNGAQDVYLICSVNERQKNCILLNCRSHEMIFDFYFSFVEQHFVSYSIVN
jgi:hypothetical protein